MTSEVTARIYTSGDLLPAGLMESNFFHSPQFFVLCQQTPRHRPYMVTLETADGLVVAQMLAVVRYRSSWFPPYYYMHCRIMGEGVYRGEWKEESGKGKEESGKWKEESGKWKEESGKGKEESGKGKEESGKGKEESGKWEEESGKWKEESGEAFGLMLQALTSRLGPRMLYVEMSHLSQKMFGYRQLRENRYFPVRWMSIHNSLHSRTPEERINDHLQRRIDAAYSRGVITDEVNDETDFKEFMKLLRHHNWLKPKRYIPADEFFKQLHAQPDNSRLFVTRYRGRVVGCSAVVYSNRQAYLWYAAYRRKTFAIAHPRELTVWHAIKDAHRRGFEHIYFMDVGLPYRKNKFRDFILRFGGKPVSTYRWFRCSIKWINSLLSWIYRD